MRLPPKILFSLLAGLFFTVGISTLIHGHISFATVWSLLVEKFSTDSNAWNPLLDERLPRLLVIACTGASLGVAGTVTQALFCNPLASPSILGITSGGSLLSIIVLILGWQLHYPFALAIASFIGCFTTLLLVCALATNHGQIRIHNLILIGIAISTVLIAAQGAIVYAIRDQWELIQTITEWEAGSSNDRNWQHVHLQMPLTIVGILGCWYYRKEIDILALGEEEALNLGVDVTTVRWRLFLCIALLTAGALASMGIIAFFGLVLPHMLRWMTGPSHSILIPICALGGATLLITFDLFLRVLGIHSISIGNASAVLGGIFFLVVLINQLQRRSLCY